MAGQYERSEIVDVVDIEYRVIDVRRQKYTCQCGGVVETAPGPERAIDGGRYSLPFAVKVSVDKYDPRPAARSMKLYGLRVDRHTLWDQIYAPMPALRRPYDALNGRLWQAARRRAFLAIATCRSSTHRRSKRPRIPVVLRRFRRGRLHRGSLQAPECL